MPVVMTSRPMDYAVQRDYGLIINNAAVVEVEPLAIIDVINYLRRSAPPLRDGRTRWDPVLSYLRERPDSALAATLTTPLMVTLARQLYTPLGTDPSDLADPDLSSAEIESLLLDAVIPLTAPSFRRQEHGTFESSSSVSWRRARCGAW
jgi:hypothetical protein